MDMPIRGGNSDVPVSVNGSPYSSSLVRGFCPHGPNSPGWPDQDRELLGPREAHIDQIAAEQPFSLQKQEGLETLIESVFEAI